ncbi:MAG: 50S ribosomal protein L21 [Rickettsiales bacterium]|nr:50S ribosomal protein L21 [Rickettsiales bacterium]
MANSDVFAVFATGGKQYRVKVGDIIKVEKLNADKTVSFDHVLMVGDKIGNPTVAGATIAGEVLEQTRTDKVIVFKKKRRHNYRRTRGHRQHITVVKITAIK